jgi:hypothetical protein
MLHWVKTADMGFSVGTQEARRRLMELLSEPEPTWPHFVVHGLSRLADRGDEAEIPFDARSADFAQQNDIAGNFATNQQQLLAVRGPVEIENSPRAELGELFGFPSI